MNMKQTLKPEITTMDKIILHFLFYIFLQQTLLVAGGIL